MLSLTCPVDKAVSESLRLLHSIFRSNADSISWSPTNPYAPNDPVNISEGHHFPPTWRREYDAGNENIKMR